MGKPTPKRKRSSPFLKPQSTMRQYEISLRKVGREVGRIIEGFDIKTPRDLPALNIALERYAHILDPWARKQAAIMIGQADTSDAKAWRAASKEMSLGLREELRSAPTGAAMRALMSEQVTLIKSLPIEAGQRVHKLVIESMADSTRAAAIAKEIARSGEVTESRATTIARTEVGRASTALTQARAQHIGAESYIWRTAHDGDVRESHKKMEGKAVTWDAPPTLDGLTGHAGALPNCRCYCEPIIPDKIE